MKKTKRERKGRLAFQAGSYSLILAAVALALVIAVNVLVSALPVTLTRYDISAAQLYSVTSNTKAVLAALQKDVEIYWIVQSGEEDSVIENLLAKYDSLSDHVTVEKRNPDAYPTFAAQYTDETVQNNSLVVVCGEKSRYIAYDDIYLTSDEAYYYYYYYGYSLSPDAFDGEGAITSAIDYVVSDELPLLYALEGHGEAELPDSFAEQIEKANMEVSSLSLLTVDEVPEDAAALVLYAPESDISEEEAELLLDYVSGGGKLFVAAGPVQDGTLTNLYSVLAAYGVEAVDGIVVEEDRNYYTSMYPYALLPELQSSDITDPLLEENYYAVMPVSLGLNVTDTSGAVTELLTTSDTSFSKAAGYNLTTWDREDGDVDGPFTLAVSVEDGGRIIWFACSEFLDDSINSLSSGANVNLAVNALSALVGERDAIAIRTRSLGYQYLTISDSAASTLKVVMIGVFPVAYLAIGIIIVLRRRRLQNAPV